MATITAFARSPDRGRGLARDMPVRWALEEVGQPYQVRLVQFDALKQPAHLAIQPFGQIPTFEEGSLALFESAAIVLHIADRYPGLLPDDPDARAQATAWMFAASSTIEPVIVERETAMLLERDQPWHPARIPIVEDRVRSRLAALSDRLGDGPWLNGTFTAGDLLMVTVLRRLGGTALLAAFANLAAYVARAESRPAFRRAFDAQLAVFLSQDEAADRSTG